MGCQRWMHDLIKTLNLTDRPSNTPCKVKYTAQSLAAEPLGEGAQSSPVHRWRLVARPTSTPAILKGDIRSCEPIPCHENQWKWLFDPNYVIQLLHIIIVLLLVLQMWISAFYIYIINNIHSEESERKYTPQFKYRDFTSTRRTYIQSAGPCSF